MEIQVNGESRQLASEATVADLLNKLGLESRFVAVEINQELVPRARHADHQLKQGDQLEIVTLVGGG